MAQRSRAGDGLRELSARIAVSCEAEEDQSIPAGTGDVRGYGAERRVMLIAAAESVCEDFDQNRSSLPDAAQHRTREGQSAVVLTRLFASNGTNGLTANRKEARRRSLTQIGI